MRTKLFGLDKQLGFAAVVKEHLRLIRPKESKHMVSLGGHTALQNEHSIENCHLGLKRLNYLTLIDKEKDVIKVWEKQATHRTRLFHGYTTEYFLKAPKDSIDVLVFDTYGMYNESVKYDIEIIKDRGILRRHGTIWLTISEHGGVKGRSDSIMSIYRRGRGNYITGVRKDLRRRLPKVKEIHPHAYKNVDLSSNALQMHLLRLEF